MTTFLFAFSALISLGVAWFFAARASKNMDPLTSLFTFQVTGVPFFLFLLPWAQFEVNFHSIIPIVLVGVFETFVMLLLFRALKLGDISVVIPISDSYVVVTVLLSILLLGESLTSPKIVGMILVMLGITLVSTKIRSSELNKVFSIKKGVVSALLAAIGTGIYFFLVGMVVKGSNWFMTALGIRIAISITSFIILIAKRENMKKMWHGVVWKWILPGALLDVLGFSFYNIALSFSEVSYATIMISAQSLVTVLLGYFILKEKIISQQWIGIFTGLAGLIILQLK